MNRLNRRLPLCAALFGALLLGSASSSLAVFGLDGDVPDVPYVSEPVEVSAAPALDAAAMRKKSRRLYDELMAQPGIDPFKAQPGERLAFVYGPASQYSMNHFFAFTLLENDSKDGMLFLSYDHAFTHRFSRDDRSGETLQAYTEYRDPGQRSGMVQAWPEQGGKIVRMSEADYKWALELAKLLQNR